MAKKATKTTDSIPEITEEAVKTTKNTAETTPSSSAELTSETEVEKTETEQFAKSGKKSKKHIEQIKAEDERQARKEETKTEAAEKKAGQRPKTRTKLERKSKKYRKANELIEKGKAYNLSQAVELALKSSPTNFDATLEAHFRLGVDPRQADQNIRATLSLPHGSGKTVRVAVFAPIDSLKIAKSAGADLAEDEDFLKKLDKQQLDFDVLITTPQYMPKLGKYARLLGPKGLMPNPKAGTVTTNIEKAVKELKNGKIEYRVDKQAVVHVGLGKLSFGADKLLENITAFLDSLKAQKPATLKGTFVKSFYLSTTMGPSILVENTLN